METEPLLTVEECAAAMRCTPYTVRERARRGLLVGAVRPAGSRRWLIPASAVSAFLRAPTSIAPPPAIAPAYAGLKSWRQFRTAA